MHRNSKSSHGGARRVNRPTRPAVKDPGAATALEEQRVAILGYFGQGQAECWKMGECYNKIVGEKLAERAGYSSASEYFAAKLGAIPQSSLSAYGRVAKAFKEAAAVQYGVAKLNLLLTWCKLRKQGSIEGDPGPMVIEVPQANGSTRK